MRIDGIKSFEMAAKATIYLQNHDDLEMLQILFSRLGIIVKDVELDTTPKSKPKSLSEEDHLRFQEASNYVSSKYNELYQRLAESERNEIKSEIRLHNLHTIDSKTITPILKRLAIDFSEKELEPTAPSH